MERAGDILKGVFSNIDPASAGKYLPLFKNFKTVLGRDLEQHVRLKDIRQHTLVAEVAHPGWMQALLLRKKAILKRINVLYPGVEIREIKVSILKKPVSPSSERLLQPAAAGVGDNGEVPDTELEDIFSRMDEGDLKKALQKLYSARPKRKFQ